MTVYRSSDSESSDHIQTKATAIFTGDNLPPLGKKAQSGEQANIANLSNNQSSLRPFANKINTFSFAEPQLLQNEPPEMLSNMSKDGDMSSNIFSETMAKSGITSDVLLASLSVNGQDFN